MKSLFDKMKTILTFTVAIASLHTLPPVFADQTVTEQTQTGMLSVGSRVLASPFSNPGQWYPATILKLEQGGFVVRFDEKPGANYSDVMKIPDTSVKTGNVGPAPKKPPITAAEARDFKLVGVIPSEPSKNQALDPNYKAKTTYPVLREENVKGKGAPPDGMYKLWKISGSSWIPMGTLEIKGNTYRGLTQTGGFHPFALDTDGGITFSSGFTGMPPGWILRKSLYTGLDPGGKARIEVRYTGVHNTIETADATHE